MFQVTVNQAYQKSVVVDPPDGACGADKRRSQIEIPRDNLNPEYLYGDGFSGGDFEPQVILIFVIPWIHSMDC